MALAEQVRRYEGMLRRGGLWLTFALVAIPLIVGNSYFFPFIVPKYLAFRIIVELLVLVYLLLLAGHPAKYKPRLSWAGWTVVAYGASAVISGAFGVDWHYSFWGTFERMESIFTTLHYVALFLVLPLMLSRDEIVRVLKVSVWASVLLCIYGLAQKSGASWTVEAGRDRISATIGNPAYVAAYLLFQMAFGVYLWAREKARVWRYVWLAIVALQLVTFIYTLTRGAMLGLIFAVPVGAGLWLWANRSKAQFATPEQKARVGKMRPWVAGLLAAMLLIPGVLVAARNTSFVKSTPLLQRFTDISPSASTAKTRFYTWNSAWQGIKEKPVLGWGPEQFPVPFNKYINPLHYTGPSSETWFDHAHNIILDIWTTQGAVGVLIWLAFIGCLLWLSLRLLAHPEQRSLGIISFCLLVAYIIQNMFLFDVLVVWMMLALTGVLLLAGQPARAAAGTAPAEAAPAAPSYSWLPVVYGIGLLLWLLPVNVRTANLSKAIIIGKQLDGNTADPMQSFEWYQQKVLNASSGTGDQEVARQVSTSFLEKIQSDAFTSKPELRPKAFAIVRPPLEQAWHRYPYDLQTPIALAKVVALEGEADNNAAGIQEAINIIQEARKYSPQRIELLHDQALYELAAGQVTSSVASFEEMVKLTNGTPFARWSLGYAYLKAGRTADAQREMEASLQDPEFKAEVDTQSNMLRRLSNLYVDTEKWDALADVYRRILSLEPSNASMWGSLALTYQKLGDYANAIAAAQEAAKADPQFAGAADQLIAELKKQQSQRR
jgi:O-antigen ligase/tetratricopeptide (TPR) repeat protein